MIPCPFLVPINYLWFLGTDVLLVYTILFMLWNVCLLRDLIFVYGKSREYDDILLFLGLGILVQVVLTAILPANQLNPNMQQNTTAWAYFYFPDVYTANYIVFWDATAETIAFGVSGYLGSPVPLATFTALLNYIYLPSLYIYLLWCL